MTLIWCGGEDIDFPNNSNLTLSGLGGTFRSDWSRCSIQTEQTANYIVRSTTFAGGPISTCWLSFRLLVGSPPVTAILNKLVGLGRSGTNESFGVGIFAASSKLAIFKSDGTTHTNLGTQANPSIAGSTLYKIDLEVVTFSSSGAVNLYIDGVLVQALTGVNLIPSTISDFDQVFLYGHTSSANNATPRFSEFIVDTGDTRSFNLRTHSINAAGDTNTFTTGAHTDVDETTISDTDVITSATAAQEFNANLVPIPSAGVTGLVCRGVKVAARALRDTTGPQSLEVGIRSGGTTNVSAAQTLDLAHTTYERLMTVNPVTTAAFTNTELDALQIALKSAA